MSRSNPSFQLHIYALPLTADRILYWCSQPFWSLFEAVHLAAGFDPSTKDTSISYELSCTNGDLVLDIWKTLRKGMDHEEITYKPLSIMPPGLTDARRERYYYFDPIDFVRYAAKFESFSRQFAAIISECQEKVIARNERPGNSMLLIRYAEKNEHKEMLKQFIATQIKNPKCTCDNASMKTYLEYHAADSTGRLIYDDTQVPLSKLLSLITKVFTKAGLSPSRVKGCTGYKKPASCKIHSIN